MYIVIKKKSFADRKAGVAFQNDAYMFQMQQVSGWWRPQKNYICIQDYMHYINKNMVSLDSHKNQYYGELEGL